MKDEATIRRHRGNLRRLMNQPCGYKGTAHDVKCQQAAVANAAVERTLSWLLGEYDKLQAMVDAIDSQVNESVPGVG